ncbi:hypothetical protein [Clostridium magnum]|nr:hypothetical protein [Clostridium magnum]
MSLDLLLKDCEINYCIFEHMKNKEYSSIFYLSFLPYQSMLCKGILDYFDIKKLRDILIQEKDCIKIIEKVRVKIKLYEEKRIGKNVEILKKMHQEWLELMNTAYNKGNYILKQIGVIKLYDFGTYNIQNEFIGNTILNSWYMSEFLDIKSIGSEETNRDVMMLSRSMGIILGTICNEYLLEKRVYVMNSQINVKDKDFLLSSNDTKIFNNKYDKYISLLLFNIICSINFVLYFLGKIVPQNNQFYFRVKYNCCYYAVSSLQKLVEYSKQNVSVNTGVEDYIIEVEELEKIKASIGGSNLRNCIAHYKISEKDISEKEILKDVPFYGLIEKYCKKDYYSLDKELQVHLENISYLLEKWILG